MDAMPLAWVAAPSCGLAALVLARAEERNPDPGNAGFDRPLNRMVTGLAAGTALAIAGALALYRFGLVWPVLAGLASLFVARLAIARNLAPYYRLKVALALAALAAALVLLGGTVL